MSTKQPINVGDYVTFHTKGGHDTGIVENIFRGDKGFKWAVITVRNGTFKPKKYHRPLFKLKKVVI